VGQDILVQKQI